MKTARSHWELRLTIDELQDRVDYDRNLQDVAHDLSEQFDQMRDTLRRDWAVRVLDAWADAHETDGFVEIARIMGDGASWTMTCKRASCRSDPSVLGEDDPSYYDDDGFRCWWFEAESANAARLAAAEAVWPQLPEPVRAEIGERP